MLLPSGDRPEPAAKIWKEGYGKAKGRAETDRVLSEAHKLLDEIRNMLTEMRRALPGRGRQQR
jgi:hypothetical protein